MQHYPGRLVVVEGPDLCGKTTQRCKIVDYLRAQGHDVIPTREPGGTPFAEKIRDLCKLKLEGEKKHSLTEYLLMSASRYQHLQELIIPALKRGAVVVTDRFVLSSLVYQVHAGAVTADEFEAIDKMVVGDLQPDLTFIFMASPEVCAQRLAKRRAELEGHPAAAVLDHFDDSDKSFLDKVRAGYMKLWPHHMVDHLVGIDADDNEDQIFARVLPHLMRLSNDLKKRPTPTV